MPRKPAAKPPVLTKKQHAHLRRDEIQTRWAIGIFAALFLLIVGIVVVGYVRSYVIRMAEPVATVYGEPITVAQFQKEVRYERLDYVQTIRNYLSVASTVTDPSTASQLKTYAGQLETYLNDTNTIGRQALATLIQNRIILHEAAVRGITVSDEEIQAQINKTFGYVPAATLTAMANASPTPTQTAVESTITASEPGGTATPAVVNTIVPIGSPTAVPPTATPYTEQGFQTRYTDFLITLKDQTGMSETDYREMVRVMLLTTKVRDIIISEVPHQQEQYHLEQIVTSDQNSAKAVRIRVVGGEDWATVAKAVSTDTKTKDQGGDMGWIGTGTLESAEETAAFALQPGETSQPVELSSGSWVILRLIEKGVRTLDDASYINAQSKYFNDWLAKIRADTNLVTNVGLTSDIIPTDPKP